MKYSSLKEKIESNIEKDKNGSLRLRFRDYVKKKICFRCDEEYMPSSYNQNFCGSKMNRTGCSWLNLKEFQKNWQKQNWQKRAKLDSLNN